MQLQTLFQDFKHWRQVGNDAKQSLLRTNSATIGLVSQLKGISLLQSSRMPTVSSWETGFLAIQQLKRMLSLQIGFLEVGKLPRKSSTYE